MCWSQQVAGFPLMPQGEDSQVGAGSSTLQFKQLLLKGSKLSWSHPARAVVSPLEVAMRYVEFEFLHQTTIKLSDSILAPPAVTCLL